MILSRIKFLKLNDSCKKAMETLNLIPDAKQREIALDPTHSFIVQAPAGSGKTTLLVQRYLALLSIVKSPEEIIAITFTRKAAAEMQNRILNALIQATQHSTQNSDKTISLAKKVLQKDQTEKWNLLQNPRKLRIQTIDALCGYLASRVPISSGMGGRGEIVQGENIEKYYRLAAENLLNDLINAEEFDKRQIRNSHLANLLLHLDNDQDYLLTLCCEMLKKREQWLPHIIGIKQHHPDQLRHILEQGLQNALGEILEKCQRNFPKELLTEINCLINFAISNLKNNDNSLPILQCADFNQHFLNKKLAPNPCNVNILHGLGDFLLTEKGTWRKTLDKRQGFPSQTEAKDKDEKLLFAEMKNRMKELLMQLEQYGVFHQNLLELQVAPSPTYTDAQWQVLCSLLEILPLLVAQLKLILHTEGAADYTEISMAADRALGYSDAPTELALNLDYRIKHLLVDEFQDTSLAQYRLLEKLTAGWENGDGRTLFLVGDPMQSIYRFRQAEVGLFLRTQNEGIGNILLQPLQLTANFRSHSKIITWINANFPLILPNYADITAGSIPFTPCEALATETEGVNDTEENFARVVVKILTDGTPEDEAHCIASKIKHILSCQSHTHPTTIAILLQARTHAEYIIKALKKEAIPYQTIELESLKSSIIIQDLFALTCALTNLSDKIAWLAILRAPWCGLSLHDLYIIANHHHPIMWQNIDDYSNIISQLELSGDGITRIKKFSEVIAPSLKSHTHNNLRNWIEEAWLKLGGPACYQDNSALEDAEKYFMLLEKHPANNHDIDLNILQQQLENLHLSTNVENAEVQIMTIHKAKGLEFDHVMVAGLARKPQADSHQLLLWLERTRLHSGSDLLLAPIKEAGEQESKIYSYLKAIEQKKSYNELSRLLYVAATRAKKSLHFFARLNHDEKTNEITSPNKGCLLERLWPCFNENWLAQEYREQSEEIATTKNEKPNDKIVLSRLTSDWQSPFSLATTNTELNDNPNSKSIINLLDDSRARLGTVVHQCLQKLAHDIENNYHNFTNIEKYIASQKTMWEKLLLQAGLYRDYPALLKKITTALKNMQKDKVGQWILSREHLEIRNEYSITTILENKIQHLIVDRTFIDKDGVRWIIDYKTSAPNKVTLEEFLKHELEKYQSQLEQYAHAFSKVENRPIWLGLYFPMCQGWCKMFYHTKN